MNVSGKSLQEDVLNTDSTEDASNKERKILKPKTIEANSTIENESSEDIPRPNFLSFEVMSELNTKLGSSPPIKTPPALPSISDLNIDDSDDKNLAEQVEVDAVHPRLVSNQKTPANTPISEENSDLSQEMIKVVPAMSDEKNLHLMIELNTKLETVTKEEGSPPPLPSSPKPKLTSSHDKFEDPEESPLPPIFPTIPKRNEKVMERENHSTDDMDYRQTQETVQYDQTDAAIVKGSPPQVPTSPKPKLDTENEDIEEENVFFDIKESKQPPIIPILPKPKNLEEIENIDINEETKVDEYLEEFLLELTGETTQKDSQKDPENKVLNFEKQHSNSNMDSQLISNTGVSEVGNSSENVEGPKIHQTPPTSPTTIGKAKIEKEKKEKDIDEKEWSMTPPAISKIKDSERFSMISNSSLVTLTSLERQESSSSSESKDTKLAEQDSMISNSSLVTLASLEIQESFENIPRSPLLEIPMTDDVMVNNSPSISLNTFDIYDDSEDDDHGDEGPKIKRTPRERRISSKHSSNRSLTSPNNFVSETDRSQDTHEIKESSLSLSTLSPSASQSMPLLLDLNDDEDDEEMSNTSSLKRTPVEKRVSSKYVRTMSQTS